MGELYKFAERDNGGLKVDFSRIIKILPQLFLDIEVIINL